MMRRYYEIMGLDEDATSEQVEKAYKKLASKYHPDKNPGNEKEAGERFGELRKAYECLRDPETRAGYDSGKMEIEGDDPAEDLFISVMESALDDFHTLPETLDKVSQILDETMNQTRELITETTRRVGSLKQAKHSIQYRGVGPNLLSRVIDYKINRYENELDSYREAVSAILKARSILEGYLDPEEFRLEKPRPPRVGKVEEPRSLKDPYKKH